MTRDPKRRKKKFLEASPLTPLAAMGIIAFYLKLLGLF